jgi:small GTP-binding protein
MIRSATFRVVMIGDSCVGKTCIVNRFIYNAFNADQGTTIGASYQSYVRDEAGSRLELQIWDTAGQERFRALGPVYYRDSAGAVAVFDVTNPATFENLESWLGSFRDAAGADAVVVVVGNKIDATAREAVSLDEARAWCEGHGLAFAAASAKTGEGITDAFETLIDLLCGKRGLQLGPRGLALQPPKQRQCC